MRRSCEFYTELVAEIFTKTGLRPARARQQANLFVTTEAKGVLSHGLALVNKYTEQFLKGTINTEPQIRIERKTPAVAAIDGDGGLGVTVAEAGIGLAMEMSETFGIASVSMTNLQHYAAGLYYAERPAAHGKILLMMANSPASIAPFGGSKKYFGTNPMTFAAPMGTLPPYCLDMASSVCAGNKLENAMNLGQKVPEGLGVDRNGAPCTDPEEILRHGSLLPFGGPKGSGIAGMINIFAGILTGAAYQDDVISLCRDRAKPSNYGCQILMLDVQRFMDMVEYTHRAEQWAHGILNNPPAKGFDRVIYPGYAEGLRLRDAREHGLVPCEVGKQSLILAEQRVGMELAEVLKED